jgi:hypothetical protein
MLNCTASASIVVRIGTRAFQVPENPVTDGLRLDARDHLEPPTAVPTGLYVEK